MQNALQEQQLQTSEDGWPWPSLLMLGLHALHLSEEQFWKMTPRKFSALIEAYTKFEEAKQGGGQDTASGTQPQPKTTTVDQIGWWDS